MKNINEIKSILTDAVIASGEISIKQLAESNRDKLICADLRGAKLADADLRDADLRGAKLADADLQGAKLVNANLTDTDLRDADLRGANFDGEILTKTPLFIDLRFSVTITTKFMYIDYQRYAISEWKAFSDDEINVMSKDALSFWKTWKKPLLAMCEAHAV